MSAKHITQLHKGKCPKRENNKHYVVLNFATDRVYYLDPRFTEEYASVFGDNLRICQMTSNTKIRGCYTVANADQYQRLLH